jgi:hypothetical protein
MNKEEVPRSMAFSFLGDPDTLGLPKERLLKASLDETM